MSSTEPLLTSQEVATLLRVSQATLSRWRTQDKGPVWVNLHGMPRYRRADVSSFIQAVSHDNQ